MANETQDQPVSGLGGIVTPPKSKGGFSVPGNVALDPTQTQSILANMQRIIDERESPLNLFTSGLKDALAYAAIDPTRNVLARDEQKMREQREMFDIRSQMAAVRANQAAQERAAKMYGLTGGTGTQQAGAAPSAGGAAPSATGMAPYEVMLNSLPPNIQPIAKKALAGGDFAAFEKLVSEHELKRPDLQKNLAFANTLPPEQRDIFLRTIQEKGYAPQSYIGPDGKEYRFSPVGAVPPEAKPAVATTTAPAAAPAAAPVSIRNNNPGNLRDTKTGEFLKFDTLEAGQKALDDDLKLKLSGQSPAVKQRFGEDANIMTPSLLAETWSPSTAPGNSPESTANYAKYIANKLGIDPTGVIPNTPEARKIVSNAITEFESGQKQGMTTKQAETVPSGAPAEPKVERKSVGQLEIEKTGAGEAAKEIGKDVGKLAAEVNRLGQSAGEREIRYKDILSIVEDKEMKEIFGKLSKQGITPFVLKQLESGASIGQFGTLGIKDLERNLTIAGASKEQIEKFLRVEKHLKQAELEYAKVYLAGQGAVSDNERRLVREAVGSTSDPVKILQMQAKVMAERAQFDKKMADAYSKYKDRAGTYADPDAFFRNEGKAIIAQHNKDLGDILGMKITENNPLQVTPEEKTAAPGKASKTDVKSDRVKNLLKKYQ
jgi:hypothetical protein